VRPLFLYILSSKFPLKVRQHGVLIHTAFLSHFLHLHGYSYSCVSVAFKNEDHTVNLNRSKAATKYMFV
jgi:hypothetical protein